MTSESGGLELRRRELARRSSLSASVELKNALEALSGHDPQQILSALVEMTPERIAAVLDDRRQRDEYNLKAVDLAAVEHVECFRRISREFQGKEEIQVAVCCVLENACLASPRFQREGGRLRLWTELTTMRRQHPLSRRILLGSLRATTAMLHNCDLNIMEFVKTSDLLKISISELLVEELLQLIERYGESVDTVGGTASSTRSKSDVDIVVVGMRLLATLLSCPTGPSGSSMLTLVRKYARQIFGSMVVNLAMFQRVNYTGTDVEDPMLTWLSACQSLVHLLSPSETLTLMFKTPGSAPWYQSIAAEHWDRAKIDSMHPYPRRHRCALMLYLTILTYMFALPHACDDSACLSILTTMLRDKVVLNSLSGVIAIFHSRVVGGDSDEIQAILLQLLRLLHLWSERSDGAVLLNANGTSLMTLVPVFAMIIESMMSSTSDHQTKRSVQSVQVHLAVLLIIQRLTASSAGVSPKLRKLLENAFRSGAQGRTPAVIRARLASTQIPFPDKSARDSIDALHSYAPSDGYDDDRSLDAVISRELARTTALFIQSGIPSISKRSFMKSSSSLLSSTRRRGSSHGFHHSLKSSTIAIYTSHS